MGTDVEVRCRLFRTANDGGRATRAYFRSGKRFVRGGLIGILALTAAACRGPETGSAGVTPPSLDGAWRLVSTETIGPDGTRYPGSTHESFLLIADGFYSMNWAFGPEKSPYYAERFNPTDEEKLARYGSLLVNAGVFERDAAVITIHPEFALVPEYVGGLGEFEYTFDDEILQLTWYRIDSADGIPDPYTEAGVRYVSRWERIPPDAPGLTP